MPAKAGIHTLIVWVPLSRRRQPYYFSASVRFLRRL